ncbi:MAG: YlmC/YmxH family sporulation protein [Clostridia bacterium]|jgi:YlmC/YmxH family sporulation protein|nr:YlmC/YmxH family sporulation protein [Clostridia bacterium]
MARFSDLRCKEVINIKDGARLGYVDDVEFECDSGKITAITVPGPARFLGMFSREADYIIPWQGIQKIGEDIILVCYDIPLRIMSQRSGGGIGKFISALFK